MNDNLTVNAAGIKILHDFEKCVLTAYKCPAGVWTIGWGNTTYADGKPVKQGDKITQKQADELFKVILASFEKMAKNAIRIKLTANQFSAFVSALYNIGHGSPKKSGLIRLTNGNPSTLLRKINTNPNDPTIREQFMAWVSKGTSYEKGLTRRRKAESDLYFS